MIEWNRNVSRTYKVGGKKIVSKNHKKPIFFKRELFFYDLFRKSSLIKTPEIYSFDRLNLQTYFIESERKDILQTAREWARVHSYFMRNPIENNHLFIQHNIKEVASYVSKNIGVFGKLGSIVERRLSGVEINKDLRTILHGDLQQKNMVTFGGDNYYFDFELGGAGHPGRDVASMIISNPNRKDELLDVYRKNCNFNYSGLGEDVDSWLMARSAQLYVIFNKREGTMGQKKELGGKLSWIIRGL
jgi:thiamine kinase-like enzyme